MPKQGRIRNMAKLPKKLKNSSILVPALVVLLIGAAFYIGSLTTQLKYLREGTGPIDPTTFPQEDPSVAAQDVERPSDGDHIRGNKDAKIAVIEYSDYECPFCGQFHPTMQRVTDELGDSVMWVYRHWPIDQIHPNAFPASVAGECVAELGGEDAFWTFTDTIFENQELLSQEKIDEWALASGVNSAQYETCKTNPDNAAKVEADLISGANAGVQGTPGVIVLNIETGEVQVLPGAVPFEQVKAAIENLQ